MANGTSILEQLATQRSFSLPPQTVIRGEPVFTIGVDNGNDAVKISLPTEGGTIVHLRIPTAHRLARTFQGGQGEVSYQIDDEPAFWIGEAAIRNEGRALRVGSTATRLVDARQSAFVAAALVEALIAAGHAPGVYPLAIGFAIPNSEIVRESQDSDKLVVVDETRHALKKYLHGKEWIVTRRDLRGEQATWTLQVKQIIPQAQSVGTFVAWGKAPGGATVTDYDAITILDIGGGDLQRTDIAMKPYRMATERIGDGTIDIARGLKELLPKAKLNDVTAQYGLVSRQALISGKWVKIDQQVRSVINSYGQDLIGKLLETVQNTQRYMIITGGGVVLLRDTIRELLEAAGLEEIRDYYLVEPELASVLNSVGALFAVVFAAGRR